MSDKLTYTREEVIELIKQVYATQKCLSTVGHILRDKYLILSLKSYGIKLMDYISYGIDYELYTHMVDIQKCIKHVHNGIHKRDIASKVIYHEKIARILGLIHLKKKSKNLDPLFKWTPESNDKLIGRYGRT